MSQPHSSRFEGRVKKHLLLNFTKKCFSAAEEIASNLTKDFVINNGIKSSSNGNVDVVYFNQWMGALQFIGLLKFAYSHFSCLVLLTVLSECTAHRYM